MMVLLGYAVAVLALVVLLAYILARLGLGHLMAVLRLLAQSVLLAFGQIRTNKGRSMLTTLGIIIGVASVTAVIAALTGLKAKVLGEFEALGTDKIFVVPIPQNQDPDHRKNWRLIRLHPEEFEGLLAHCPSVAGFTRITRNSDVVRYGQNLISDASLIGIEPSWHDIERRAILQGRPFSMIDSDNGRNVCLITGKVIDALRLPRECVGQSILLGNQTFLIIGVVEDRAESSMFGGGGGDKEVFVPFNALWRMMGRYGFMYAMVACRSPELSEDARAELRFFMRQARHRRPEQEDDFRLEVVEQYLRQFSTIASVMTLVAAGIVSISLVVGGVGIMNIMLVSVSERTREIGLRKAVGARPSAIMLQFLVEAVMLCLCGGAIGVLGGEGLTRIMASIKQAGLEKAYIPTWAVGLSFGFAALVGITFGFFPALKASRLDPIEALRHE